MKKYLTKLINQEDLLEIEISEVFENIISGQTDSIMAGAILTALASKGESEEEILGIVKTMRKHMVRLDAGGVFLDTCGTGGDGANTINVSTITAILCAAAGVKVVKHGNRSVSSTCGSFDCLEKTGVKIDINKDKAQECLVEIGLACLFAPLYHPAMKNIVPVRKALGIRTVFNIIGPLLNPALAKYQIIGVYSDQIVKKLGNVLMQLGSKKVLLVHSEDGLDEISVAAPTTIYEFKQGSNPKKYAVEPAGNFSLNQVVGGGVEENTKIMKRILEGKGSDAQNEFAALNVAGALLASEVVENFEQGKQKAYELLNSGIGIKKLDELIKFTNS